MPEQKQTAINATGFEIDVIRRMTIDADPHPFKMSDFEDDLWAVQISDGNKMLGSRRFSQVIVSETGHMAVMDTMSPTLFVALKKRLSKSASRYPQKRPKDDLQATLVQALIDGYMPQYHG
jgi:hypothetical protein